MCRERPKCSSQEMLTWTVSFTLSFVLVRISRARISSISKVYSCGLTIIIIMIIIITCFSASFDVNNYK